MAMHATHRLIAVTHTYIQAPTGCGNCMHFRLYTHLAPAYPRTALVQPYSGAVPYITENCHCWLHIYVRIHTVPATKSLGATCCLFTLTIQHTCQTHSVSVGCRQQPTGVSTTPCTASRPVCMYTLGDHHSHSLSHMATGVRDASHT
jgi:hypothetical protein